MPSLTVKAVEQAAAGSGDKGPWTRQKLTVVNGDGQEFQATLFCHQYVPVPSVGAVLEATVKPPKQEGWLPELELPRKGGGGGGRMDSPETRRSIAMQHAQKCAVDALRLAAEHGDYKPPSAGDVASQIKSVALVLWQQVMDAEKGSQ